MRLNNRNAYAARSVATFFLALAIIALPKAAYAADDSSVGLYMFHISSESTEAGVAALDFSQPLQVTLRSADLLGLYKQLEKTNAHEVALSEETITLTLPLETTFQSSATAQNQNASWVIDYDETSVFELVTEFREDADRVANLATINRFVSDNIPEKSYRNGFDIASQVAEHGEGDCTEHAVLATAVSRALGIPSRVALGVLLVFSEGKMHAYGHARSELFVNTQWQVADATLPLENEKIDGVYYLPISLFDNEGPGYLMQMVQFAKLQPTKITLPR